MGVFFNALLGRRPATEYFDAMKEFCGGEVAGASMRAAVEQWYRLYYGSRQTSGDLEPGCRVAYTIVQKLCRAVLGEYEAVFPGGQNFTGNEPLAMALENFSRVRYGAMTQAMVGGECLIKPVISRNGFEFFVIKRPNYCVLERDETGKAVAYGTAEVTLVEKNIYTLLEERRVDKDGYCHIKNRLFCSRSKAAKGREVPLDALEKYEGLVPEMTLPLPLGSTGLIPLKMPIENCVDGSAEGVSIYGAAVDLINSLDLLEGQLCKEFKHAASKIIASRDLLIEGHGGRMALEDDVFIGLDEDPSTLGVTIFNPAIRDESYLRRKNDLLRGIENIIGMKRGVLSEVEASERTATEITSSAGEYSLTILALQSAFKETATETMRVCSLLGQCYFGWPEPVHTQPYIQFGDGILMDRAAVWGEYRTMVKDGLLRPEVALAWYFGRKSTEAELEKIRHELMPEERAATKEVTEDERATSAR